MPGAAPNAAVSGRRCGGFSHGKHHRYEGDHDPSLSNLYVTLLQAMGVETDQFGQSSGTLTWS